MRAKSRLTLWVVFTMAFSASACTQTFKVTPRSVIEEPASPLLPGAALIDLTTMTIVRRTGVTKINNYPNPALIVVPSEPRISLLKATVDGTAGRSDIPRDMIQQGARFKLLTVYGRRHSVEIVRYRSGYRTFARMTLEISK